jgi:hypothetical protein
MSKKKTELEKELAEIATKILDAKILYFQPKKLSENFVNATLPSDEVYNAMERRYLNLCKRLNHPNTLVAEHAALSVGVGGPGMFEVDHARADVMAAYQSLLERERLYKSGK